MILPKQLPKSIRDLVSWEYVPENRMHEAGWDVPNSVIARDCVPLFRLQSPGTRSGGLTDFKTACMECIERQDERIAECERLKVKLRKACEHLEGEKG